MNRWFMYIICGRNLNILKECNSVLWIGTLGQPVLAQGLSLH